MKRNKKHELKAKKASLTTLRSLLKSIICDSIFTVWKRKKSHSMSVGGDGEERVAQCLRMLQGATDEHKFAGLLMVTKLDGLSLERLQQVRRQVLETVGAAFFLRLLHTRGRSRCLWS